jgi:hypothetical protein
VGKNILTNKYISKNSCFNFFALLTILAFVGLSFGCGGSKGWVGLHYDISPEKVYKDGWEIEFHLQQVKYDDTLKKYMATDEKTGDPLYQLVVMFRFIDQIKPVPKFIRLENVEAYFDDDTKPIKLNKQEEYLEPDNTYVHQEYDYGFIKPGGRKPKVIRAAMDVIIYDKNTDQTLARHHVVTTGNLK